MVLTFNPFLISTTSNFSKKNKTYKILQERKILEKNNYNILNHKQNKKNVNSLSLKLLKINLMMINKK